MNKIKNHFSIKDLENLSGIKAHTIRIWEKRYNLLVPSRTESNIRTYDIKNLQKILNVALLQQWGHKISKIAKYDENEIQGIINTEISKGEGYEEFIKLFKLSMINYDSELFNSTFNRLLIEQSFRQIFLNVFIPLLNQIGLQWQSDSITPSHEHFISNLIKQKLYLNIERQHNSKQIKQNRTFVLYLPENEIHEMGLLYLYYELLSKECHTIYLGQSVPRENLKHLMRKHNQLIFISYFTVQPDQNGINEYMSKINREILVNKDDQFWVLGRMTMHLELSAEMKQIQKFKSIQELIDRV